MKNSTRNAFIFLFICILILSLFSCSEQFNAPPGSSGAGSSATPANGSQTVDVTNFSAKTKQTNAFFATTSTLCLYNDYNKAENAVAFQNVWEEVKLLLAEIENTVSVSVDTSDIARFNTLSYGGSMKISNHTARIIETAKDVYEKTSGLYDPTVYPLVDLWGFTPRFNVLGYAPAFAYDRERSGDGFPLPDKKYVDAFLKITDFSGIVLTGNEQNGYELKKMIRPVTVDSVQYDAQLDLGGIAKGYAADKVIELLQSRHYEYGYFSCGSSSMGLMKSASDKARQSGTVQFNLGIRKPRAGKTEDEAYMTVKVSDVYLSSSGDYNLFYKLGDTIYCHILNPFTGLPMNTPAGSAQRGIATVTVIGGYAAYNDALSTALCVMEPAAAIDYINKELKNYKAILVLYHAGYDTYEVVTNMKQNEYYINDAAYVLSSSIDGNGNILYSGKFMTAG
ncbi:MAG: FAD:protein FMN transferase [Christensenellales bacterium]